MWEEGRGDGVAMRLGRREEGEGCAEATWREGEGRGAQRPLGGVGKGWGRGGGREEGEGVLGLVVVSV